MYITSTTCHDCGERWTDAPGHPRHWCPPNETGLHVGDPVTVAGLQGEVKAIDVRAGLVDVYFRTAGFVTHTYPLAMVEPVPVAA